VPELAVKGLVLVVANLEQSVFDAEGIAEIVAEIVLGDLGHPALEVGAIEQDDPVFLARVGIYDGRLGARGQCRQREQSEGRERGESNLVHDHSCRA
jgi:hypothetical protein